MLHRIISIIIITISLYLPLFAPPLSKPPAANLQALAKEFFAWRASTQPASYDDVNRVERPDGWTPDFSASALRQHDEVRKKFHDRLDALDHGGWTVADSVDYLFLRAAMERVNYELNIVRSARRNPDFYVHQTLGIIYELILPPPPFSDARAKNIVLRMQSIPNTVQYAKANLTEGVRFFADIALANLAGVREKLDRVVRGLTPLFPKAQQKPLSEAAKRAAAALEDYAAWIEQQKPHMGANFAIGAQSYDWYLRNIALIPFTREEMLLMARQEWDRAVAFHHYAGLRNAEILKPALFKNSAGQIEACKRQEQAIREFMIKKGVLDVPEWMGHYGNLKMPDYIAALSHLGVVDDLTGPSRLGENGVSYIPEPAPNLSFFRLATAQDPRPIIVHEGTPGHYFQLSLSWAHTDFIRRQYIDSGPVEGLGFYAEEMMLQHGLFDDAPHTHEIIYRFMRLRALRVEVDIKLATGEFSIQDAGRYLAETVPMDQATAEQEAAFFASNPGQAISYQIGKIQIVRFLSEAKIKLGPAFSLRAFHNFLWQNGNVPVALQEWEYLGQSEEVRKFF
ncbi:DUF885 domain-containing protein [candidate division KSB1 bacterium]|nr:DUF885 domain-containing protein [candidate division KSB1 bacterium]